MTPLQLEQNQIQGEFLNQYALRKYEYE